MQLNATANTKFLREMKDSQQLTSQQITELEQKVSHHQAVIKRLRTIAILILIAMVILLTIYKVTRV